MGKRPASVSTAITLVEILQRIPRGRKVTAREIRQQLQDAGTSLDLRTVQRHLDALSEHFHLDRDERSRPYGYSWPAHARGLAVPCLTLPESLVLHLAQQRLINLLPTQLVHTLQPLFAQADINLGGARAGTLERQWPSKIRVVATSQPLLPPRLNPRVFDAVCDALYRNHWLHVKYRNAAGTVLDTRVMPLGLAQQGPRLYLVCRFDGYSDDRSIALHRIRGARVSTLDFVRPPGFSLQRYDDEGRFGFGNGRRVRLSFRIRKADGAHLLETPLSCGQTVIAGEDSYAITATVVDTAMLDWWLRKFGDAVSEVRREPLDDVADDSDARLPDKPHSAFSTIDDKAMR